VCVCVCVCVCVLFPTASKVLRDLGHLYFYCFLWHFYAILFNFV